MDQNSLDLRLEAICEQGCVRVNQLILEMESGVKPKEVHDLDRQDCQQVLLQLQKIMSVYTSCKAGPD